SEFFGYLQRFRFYRRRGSKCAAQQQKNSCGAVNSFSFTRSCWRAAIALVRRNDWWCIHLKGTVRSALFFSFLELASSLTSMTTTVISSDCAELPSRLVQLSTSLSNTVAKSSGEECWWTAMVSFS